MTGTRGLPLQVATPSSSTLLLIVLELVGHEQVTIFSNEDKHINKDQGTSLTLLNVMSFLPWFRIFKQLLCSFAQTYVI